uniref:Uncharacterized protein n=1 Tax=Schistosoma mansoni TaxID=6183 RepID=A0A5K4F8T7_SCHMA
MIINITIKSQIHWTNSYKHFSEALEKEEKKLIFFSKKKKEKSESSSTLSFLYQLHPFPPRY